MQTIRGFGESLSHAWDGVRIAFRSERSFRLQIAASFAILLAILLLPLERWEQVILLLAIAMVLVLELVNSMVERLVDLVKPRINSYVKEIKDLMAAAVLIAALFAAAIGIVILGPYAQIALGRL